MFFIVKSRTVAYLKVGYIMGFQIGDEELNMKLINR